MPSTPTEAKHTPTPWKVVSYPHFDSGLVYTSIQPVNIDEEAMKPLAMANGEYHICRMSHTAAEWRFNYHRANAAFIVQCVNERASPLSLIEDMAKALEPFADQAETFDSDGKEFVPDQFEPAIVGHTIGDLRKSRSALSRYTEFMEQNNG